MVQTGHTSGSSWSVKQPNELNLVFGIAHETSPCHTNSRGSYKPSSPNLSSGNYQQELDNKLQRLATPKNLFQNRRGTHQEEKSKRSAFFQQDNTKVKVTKIPSLPKRVLNSHLPDKALNYLTMVDEPGIERVISRFGGHSFQDQFRKPLRQTQNTLFLSSVRDRAQLPHQLEQLDTQVKVVPTQISAGWRPSRDEARRRAESLHSGLGQHKQSVNIETTGPSRLKSRQPNVPSANGADQIGPGTIVFSRRGKSVSHTPKYQVSFRESISTAQQDSIESVMGPTLSGISVEDSQMKAVKEMWYFNIDRGAYQPTFNENIAQQVQRKEQIFSHHGKSRQIHPLSTQQSQFKNKIGAGVEKQETFNSVIGSSFRVRDIQGNIHQEMLKKVKNTFATIKVPHTTKNKTGTILEINNQPEVTEYLPLKKDAASNVESSEVDQQTNEVNSEKRSMAAIGGLDNIDFLRVTGRCCSNRDQSIASSVLVQDEANYGDKLSNSISAQQPSSLGTPMHSKIVVKGRNSQMSRVSDKAVPRDDSPSTFGRSKVFVSGSMMIKPLLDPQINEKVEIMKVIHEPSRRDTRGGHSTEELSINNLHKNTEGFVALAVIGQTKSNNLANEEYVARVRASAADYEEFRRVGIISQKFRGPRASSNNDNVSVDQQMSAIGCSTGRNTVQNSKDIAHIIPGESVELQQNQFWDPNNMMIQAIASVSSQKQHSVHHNSMALRRKMDELILEGGGHSQPNNAALMKAYQDYFGQEKECSPKQYVITQYSLPKALTATTRTIVSHKCAISQQSQRIRRQDCDVHSRFKTDALPTPSNIGTLTPPDTENPSSLEDIEQFTYERENRKMLTGPPGRKLSKPQAFRLQHNLQMRRAASKRNKSHSDSMPKSMTVHQPQISTAMPTEVSFREPESMQKSRFEQPQSTSRFNTVNQNSPVISISDKKTMNCKGKTLDVKKTSIFHERIMRKQQKSDGREQRPPPRRLQTSKTEYSPTNEDLPISVTSRDAPGSGGSRNRNRKVNVIITKQSKLTAPHSPTFKLNKVDLEIFSGQAQAFSNKPLSPQFTNGNRPFATNIEQEAARRLQITATTSPHLQPYGAHVGRNNPRSPLTRMISIEVQTQANKRHKEFQDQNKIKIITQEKSVQDTLYDVVDQKQLQSQKQMLSGIDFGSKVLITDSKKPKIMINKNKMNQFNRPVDSDELMPESDYQNKKIELSSTPATVLVSRENLASKDKILSETAIGFTNNVRDSTKMNNERQRSQLFQPQTAEKRSSYTADDKELSQANIPQAVTDYSEPRSALLDGAIDMPNKYDEAAMDTSLCGDNSLHTLPSRSQPYSNMMNQDLVAQQTHDLNIVVKTATIATVKPIVTKTHHPSNNNVAIEKEVMTKDPSVKDVKPASTDREEFYKKNDLSLLEVNQAMLRYSSDRQETLQLKTNSSQLKNAAVKNQVTLQTVRTNSLGVEEKNELRSKLRNCQDSFNSSEYVSLKINQDPDGHNSRHEVSTSVEKTTVYQLQAKFINPSHPNGSALSRRLQFPENNLLSIGSQPSQLAKSQRSSIDESQDDSRINRANTPPRRHTEVDPYWLDKYMKLQQKQYQRQYDRQQQQERQERILASKTAHLVKPQRRQHTPPISRNKLLQVPQKPHNRTKLGNNQHAVVEQIWAKNVSHVAASFGK